MGKFQPKTIHLDGKGFEKVLGELETKIMEIAWQEDFVSVRMVRDSLEKSHKDLSFNSVMTIMNRLVDKDLLTKKVKAGINVYSAKVTKKEFSKSVAKNIFTSLLKDPSFFGAAGFAELASDLDKDILDKLKKIIK